MKKNYLSKYPVLMALVGTMTHMSKGIDYPLPFLRWTEKRNFEAILEAIRIRSLNVNELITDRVSLEDYNQIYENIDSGNSIASLLIYSGLNQHELK